MATANELTQQHIVHVHADSEQELDELFRAAKDHRFPTTKPMRDRNLPASFFTPPETGTKSASHSRESSIDQSKQQTYLKQIIVPTTNADNKQHLIQINHQQKLNILNRSGIPIAHSRAHSSPASLQKTALSVVPQQAQTQLNNSNQNINQISNQQPQINHQTVQQTQINTTTIQHIRQLSDINQIPLPKGWEQSIDQSTGRVYFINHNEKTTTWVDPRLATQQQQLKLLHLQLEQQKQIELQKQQQMQAQLQQQQIQQFQQQIIQQNQPQQPNQLIIQQNGSQTNNQQILIQQNNTKLPDGWEQRQTEDGEIYFIDHNNQKTQWVDPRIPIQLQKQTINRPPPPELHQTSQIVQQQNQPTNQLTNSDLIQQQQNLIQQQQQQIQQQQTQQQQMQQQSQQILIQAQQSQAGTVQNLQNIQNIQNIPNDCQIRLQQLELEREKMKQRQLEIQNQQRLYNQSVMSNQENNENITTNCNNLTTTGIDPFLTATGENHHRREESADSGLGLGSTYSLPNTPDDMLDNDVDLNDLNDLNDCNNYVSEDLGLDSLAISSMDLDENMESDDLLPNLPDEINCPDIQLSDIDAILAGNSTNRDNWINLS